MSFLNGPYALTVVRDCGCLAGVSFEASPQGVAEFLSQWPDEGYRVEVATQTKFRARKCEAHTAAVSS